MKRPLLGIVALLWSLLVGGVTASSPWAMSWTSQGFGPDGPWQAVSITIGSNDTNINLYPGASWTTNILLSDVCVNSSYCYASEAGLFNPHNSDTYNESATTLPPNGEWGGLANGYTDAIPIYAQARRALDNMNLGGISVSSINLIAISQGYQIYPDGKNYPLEVGTLSLGAPDINETFSSFDGTVNGTFITSWLYQAGSIPSYSYGMHIGSAALQIPGSLYLGGYDQTRVIGEVSSQATDSGALPIQLVDISIGIAAGNSPWNSSHMTGLLAQGNSSLKSGLNVYVDPTNPYIYLPSSSCDAIASELPVHYNPDLGLYLWDKSSSMYSQILRSPSYLAFTFTKDGVNDDAIVTIKVPFALLNLTLEAPLVSTPTPYFPCMGSAASPALGRAFLQAAFVGVQWSTKSWFLAQAPGPDISSVGKVVSIGSTDTTISGSNSNWVDTWSSHWTPLSNSPSYDAKTSSDISSGLSAGAKGGIGVGCGIAGLLLIALLYWFLRRRSGNNVAKQKVDSTGKGTIQPQNHPQLTPAKAPGARDITVHELNNHTIHELKDNSLHELG